jgi:hypothetical protein
MEAELNKKLNEMYIIQSYHSIFSKDSNKGTTGILVIDKFGLPIESQGSLDKN